MARWVALLRAVNVGGTGKLPMADLRRIATGLGFEAVETHLASGNLIFTDDRPEAALREAASGGLAAQMGRAPGLLFRQPVELEETLAAIPFGDATPSQVGILFLDRPATEADLVPRHQTLEVIAPTGRHVAVHFPDGMGRSRLSLPAMERGTMRNLNTLAALVKKAR